MPAAYRLIMKIDSSSSCLQSHPFFPRRRCLACGLDTHSRLACPTNESLDTQQITASSSVVPGGASPRSVCPPSCPWAQLPLLTLRASPSRGLSSISCVGSATVMIHGAFGTGLSSQGLCPQGQTFVEHVLQRDPAMRRDRTWDLSYTGASVCLNGSSDDPSQQVVLANEGRYSCFTTRLFPIDRRDRKRTEISHRSNGELQQGGREVEPTFRAFQGQEYR